MEKLNRMGAIIEQMLNKSKTEMGCLLNGTGMGRFYNVYCTCNTYVCKPSSSYAAPEVLLGPVEE